MVGRESDKGKGECTFSTMGRHPLKSSEKEEGHDGKNASRIPPEESPDGCRPESPESLPDSPSDDEGSECQKIAHRVGGISWIGPRKPIYPDFLATSLVQTERPLRKALRRWLNSLF